MTQSNRLDEIRQRLGSNLYFVNPLSDANVRDDISYLISLVEEKDRRIEELNNKNKMLASHALELSQEIENVKSDFGSDPR